MHIWMDAASQLSVEVIILSYWQKVSEIWSPQSGSREWNVDRRTDRRMETREYNGRVGYTQPAQKGEII